MLSHCFCFIFVNSYLFFADLGNSSPGNVPRIERTFMDGSNRWNLKITKILNPQGLTVDSINHRLFWVDSHLDHLETVDYDGLNRWAVRKVKRCVWIKRNLSIFEVCLYGIHCFYDIPRFKKNLLI